jgi:hypothetical protein
MPGCIQTESRYGTNSSPFFFPLLPSLLEAAASDEITFPRVVRDLLMFAPSFNRWPVAPVEFARSEPAKSTRLPEVRPEFITRKTSDPT